jgi:hypothetical protein
MLQLTMTVMHERTHTMTQNEAVFQAVFAVFGEVLERDGMVPETGEWNDVQKDQVHAMLLASFKRGEWDKKSGGQTDADLKKYIPGLVNNHVRKDLRLNGGTKYAAKNPGSRAGSGDDALKAMRVLLAMTPDAGAKATIEAEIAKRISELKPKPVLDYSKLPESLRHLAPKS